jgi:hypothetical protein
MMERGMRRHVVQMEQMWGGQDNLSRLSDAELDAAINEVQQRLLESYGSALGPFNTSGKADQAEAVLRKIEARGEAATRSSQGVSRYAPPPARSTSREAYRGTHYPA